MDTTSVTVRHNADGHRFELVDGERVIGQAHYLPDTGSGERIFHHTVVDEAYEGHGLASKLATFALDETVAAGLRIVPVCPYIHAFLGRHREYADDVVEVRPEHLDALRH